MSYVPYTWRIVAWLPDQAPIEIVRFNRQLTSADMGSWIASIGDAWEYRVEHRTPDFRCLGGTRIGQTVPTYNGFSREP